MHEQTISVEHFLETLYIKNLRVERELVFEYLLDVDRGRYSKPLTNTFLNGILATFQEQRYILLDRVFATYVVIRGLNEFYDMGDRLPVNMEKCFNDEQIFTFKHLMKQQGNINAVFCVNLFRCEPYRVKNFNSNNIEPLKVFEIGHRVCTMAMSRMRDLEKKYTDSEKSLFADRLLALDGLFNKNDINARQRIILFLATMYVDAYNDKACLFHIMEDLRSIASAGYPEVFELLTGSCKCDALKSYYNMAFYGFYY